jgi:hypothetical protein
MDTIAETQAARKPELALQPKECQDRYQTCDGSSPQAAS